jgi:hypothetical protein
MVAKSCSQAWCHGQFAGSRSRIQRAEVVTRAGMLTSRARMVPVRVYGMPSHHGGTEF